MLSNSGAAGSETHSSFSKQAYGWLQEPSKTAHFGHLASERQSVTSKAERDVHGDLRHDACTPQAAGDQI
jgi:hypothetical protein